MLKQQNQGETAQMFILNKEDLREVINEAMTQRQAEIENEDEILYTVNQTAAILEVDKSTLWRWHRDGYLVKIKIGRKVRYRKSDVMRIKKGLA